MILALKPFEFRRVKYAAGDPLPASILRSVELREMQRRGYIHPRASLEMARAPLEAPPVAPAATLPEPPPWLSDAAPGPGPESPRRGRRGRAPQ